MKQQTLLEAKKEIGNLKANFKASFDEKNDNHIFLSIEVTPDLQKLLKFACSETNKGFSDSPYYTIDEKNIKRYKVKDWIFGILYNHKEILFLKDLIDDGKIEIPFNSLQTIEGIINYTRDNIKRVIEEIMRAKKLNISVTYN